MNNPAQLSCYGGVGTVTGANFLLEIGQSRIAVDCGLLQGTPEAGAENSSNFSYDPASVQFLFVTHAHMDHIGKIPKLVKDGFRGVIYSTPETRELAALMLQDALKVMTLNAKSGAFSEEVVEPLYGESDMHKTFELWQTISYHTETKINDDFSVYIMDAGHILGSAMYKISWGEGSDKHTIVFTGDSGNSPAPLLKDTDKIEGVDYLVMDSVYGDRNHEPKDERDARFREIVTDTINKGGTLVIPAFSLERTQVILFELNNLIEGNKIPSIPVFLDSPLGTKVTEIYRHMAKDFNEEVQGQIKSGDDIFNFPKLQITHNAEESREIMFGPTPKIIIAGSGMSSGGRVLQHEINFLPDPKSTLLLMGYQAIGTLGRTLQNKPESVEIQGQKVTVRARIEMISGYSSHKDSEHLIEMVSDTAKTVKKVFVTMGEPASSAFLVQRLRDYLDVDALYPERGKAYLLE